MAEAKSGSGGCCGKAASTPAPRALPEEVARALAENRPAFLRFLVGRVRDAALAEDLLQDAYARAIDHLGSLQKDEAAVAWFYRTLRNGLIDHGRRIEAAGRALDAFADESETQVDAREVAPANTCRCISRLARSMKPEYAAALQRLEVDGVSAKEFAGEAGISASNAAVRAFRAREALRRDVMATCGACAEAGCLDCTCSTADVG